MMGSKERHFAPLIQISLEELVPHDQFYRSLDRALDLTVLATWSIRSIIEGTERLSSFFSFVISRSGEDKKVSCMSGSSIEFPTFLSMRLI